MIASWALNAFAFVFDKRYGTLPYIFKTTFLSLSIVFALLIPIGLIKFGLLHEEANKLAPPTVIGLLVIAPIFENLIFIGLIEFMLAFELRVVIMVVVVALLSALAHGLAADWRALSGLVGFTTMSYAYLNWSECPFYKRYAITVGQHILFNTPSAILILTNAVD